MNRNVLIRQLLILIVTLAIVALVGMRFVRRAEQSKQDSNSANAVDAISVSDEGRKAIQFDVEPVRAVSLEGNVKATGIISVPADRIVKISPRLFGATQLPQGRVKKVFVKMGDHVRAGQTIAILDSLDAANAANTLAQSDNKLRLAKETLDRTERLFKLGTPDVTLAEANLKTARQALEIAKVSLEQAVTSAESTLRQAKQQQKYADIALEQQEEQARIGGFTQKPLADAQTAVVAARTSMQQANADLALAQKEFDRTGRLKEIGLATDRDLVNARNAYEKATSGVNGAKETLEFAQEPLEREKKAFKTGLYANQALENARSNKRQADIGVSAAETALRVARASGQSNVRQAELSVQAADKALRLAKAQILRDLLQARTDYGNAQLDNMYAHRVFRLHGVNGKDATLDINSPLSGIVVERNVNPGQLVDTSQANPWQMFTIADYSTMWVEGDVYEKDLYKVRVGQPMSIAVASLPGRKFTGTVKYIASMLNPNSRAVKVRSEIVNAGGLLKSGLFADVTIDVGAGPPSLVIPASAVQVDGDQNFVFVETPDHKYRKRTVHVDPVKEGFVVRDGLKAGERVVTHGALLLAATQTSY